MKNTYAAKLEDTDIPMIRRLWLDGFSIHKIAAKFDVHYTTIHYIVTGKTWGHVEGIA